MDSFCAPTTQHFPQPRATTAALAPQSCSLGSSGKFFPGFSRKYARKYALYSATNSYQPLAGTAVSSLDSKALFHGSEMALEVLLGPTHHHRGIHLHKA